MKNKNSSDAPAKGKHDAKAIAKTAGLTVGSALVGGAAGAAIGRPSLGVGLLVLIGGAFAAQNPKYKEYSVPMLVGGATMAVAHSSAKVVETTAPVSGLAGTMEDAKTRAMDFLKGLGHKTYVEKVSPELAVKMGLAGLGNVATERVYLPAKSPEVSSAQLATILNRLNSSSTQHVPVAGLGNPDISLLEGIDREALLSGIL